RRRPGEDRAHQRRAGVRHPGFAAGSSLTVARLRYVDPGASTAADAAYAEVGRMGRPILNLYRALANQPPALAAFLQMSRYVRSESSLEPGLRELVILATAQELKQAYELSHHVQAAAGVGVDAAKVMALMPGGSLDAFP